MIVVCTGMFRSGSTWQYQVASDLLSRSSRHVHTRGYLHGHQIQELLLSHEDKHSVHVMKTHDIVPELVDAEPERVRVLYSYRDVRDVVFSMAHKLSGDYHQAVHEWHIIDHSLELDAFWTTNRPDVSQRYEHWFGNTLPWVLAIATAIGIPLSLSDAEDLCIKYRMASQKQRTVHLTRKLSDDGIDLSDPANALRYDATSLLHWNHLRDGRIGSWRDLATPEQIGELADRCSSWLLQRGYETSYDWSHARRRAA